MNPAINQIKNVYRCLSYFGLTRLRYAADGIKVDNKFILGPIIWMVIVVLLAIKHNTSLRSISISFAGNLAADLSIITCILGIFTFMIVMNRQKHLKLILDIIHTSIPGPKIKIKSTTYIVMGLIATACLVLDVAALFVSIYISGRGMSELLIYSSKILIHSLLNLYRCVHVFLFCKIKNKYILTNSALRNAIQKYESDKDLNVFKKNTKSLLSIQHELRELSKALHQCLNWPILFMVLCSVIRVVDEFAYLISKIKLAETSVSSRIIRKCFSMSAQLVFFSLTIRPYQDILDLNNEFYYTLLDFLGKNLEDMDDGDQLMDEEHIVEHRISQGLKFDIFGLYCVDKTLIITLMEALVTYTVIVVQYS